LPHSEAAQDRGIVLPLYPQMTDVDLSTTVTALRDACVMAGERMRRRVEA
jgi:dTDP-4-amino-4,6-dideoxygalactose transaminase